MINLSLIALFIVCVWFINQYGDYYTNNNDNQLVEWYEEAKYFKDFNHVTFYKLKLLLKRYRYSIKTIETLECNRSTKHKEMLPILSQQIINCFQSMVHSLPVSELDYFNNLLNRLTLIINQTSYQTIVNFYKLDTTMKDRASDYYINLKQDWYLNYYKNPQPFNPVINYNYDWL